MSSRPWVKPVGWVVIVLFPVLVLACVEAAVRLLGIEPSVERSASVPAWLDRNILVKEQRWIELLSEHPRDMHNYYRTYRWDRHLFYRLQPDLDIPLTDVMAPPEIRERTRWLFHTNSRGFNAREGPLEKPAGTFRILTLGDSSTFGWGVDTEAAYPHVLERLLGRRHPGVRIEVINLGVCGYSSFQGRLLLEREALAYRPDIVTLSYGSNDYSKVPETFEAAHARNQSWSGALRELLNRSLAYRIYAAYLTSRFLSETAAAGEEDDLVFNVGPERSRANLEEMARFSIDRGLEPIFVTNCVPAEMSEPIRAAARETGTPLLETAEVLEGAVGEILEGRRFSREFAATRGLYGPAAIADHPWLAVYLTDRCHPNMTGHMLIAEALASMVESSRSFRSFLSGQQ